MKGKSMNIFAKLLKKPNFSYGSNYRDSNENFRDYIQYMKYLGEL